MASGCVLNLYRSKQGSVNKTIYVGFHKELISLPADPLLVSQEGLWSMDLVQ
jgi:hypothetical protein